MRINHTQASHRPFELAHGAIAWTRLSRHVDGGRIVEMDRERCRVAGGFNNVVEKKIELTNARRPGRRVGRIGTWRGYTVAVRRARRAAREMVAFVGSEDEQGVVLGEPRLREVGNKCAERGVLITHLPPTPA